MKKTAAIILIFSFGFTSGYFVKDYIAPEVEVVKTVETVKEIYFTEKPEAIPEKERKEIVKEKAETEKPEAIPEKEGKEIMTSEQWEIVKEKAEEFGISPYLISAIGWHETGFGSYENSAGIDWVLGYGYYGKDNYEDWAKGFENQIHYASKQIKRQHENKDLLKPDYETFVAIAEKTYRPAGFGEENPYKVWADNVYNYYKEFQK